MFDLSNAIVCDIETDSLDPAVVHCVVTSTLDGQITEFIKPSKDELQKYFDNVSCVIGHFFMSFDAPALEKVLSVTIPQNKILDTFVLSRLFNYGIQGGHSIEAWGLRLGEKKQHAELTDFTTFTPEVLERCISDVKVSLKLFQKFERLIKDEEWHSSIELEHDVQMKCLEMTKNGLPFDTELATRLYTDISERLAPLDKAILTDFPPRSKLIKEVHPRRTKAGYLHSGDFRWHEGDLSQFTGGAFSRFEYVPFNPASPKQIVERMYEAGWKPTEKTKGHIQALRERKTPKDRLDEYKKYGWKVSEENLNTLPVSAPESAHSIAQRITLSSRLSSLDEWLGMVKDGKIHGRYNSIGAWTHRLSHQAPNTANIPVASRSPHDTEFQTYINDVNDTMRSLFIAPPGQVLIGTDADGIQMRVFAHLINSPDLIEALVSGDKTKKTDIHNLHMKYLGSVCKSRDVAKTFIYAWLLGAGTGKVAEILECSFKEAKEAVNSFLRNYPGLTMLKQKIIPRDANRGYFIGLDGRKVVLKAERLGLSGHLQNGEKVIMARALRQWYAEAKKAKLPFWLVNWVHDEWQTLTLEDKGVISELQHMQIQAIRDQADQLNLNCPLDGSSSWGHSWKETH